MSSDPIDNTQALVTIDTAKYAILAPTTTELDVNGTLEPGDLVRVHVPPGGGTVWHVPGINGPEPVDQLEGVILYWCDTRALWHRAPEDDVPGTPPDCSSRDAITGVGNPGGSCRDCRFAEFGSASNGRGQKCRLTRELFFVREEDHIPLIIVVAPSSYRAVRQFTLSLRRIKKPHYHVLARLGLSAVLQPGRNYSRIEPRFGGLVDPKHHDQFTELHRMLAK
jgi:hypothetical protein